jgi:hypothetical protein
MKTPESSQAPDLMRMVSWIKLWEEKFLFAMVIACVKVSIHLVLPQRGPLTMFAKKGNKLTISTPYNIFDRWTIDLSDLFTLLDIVKNNRAA